MSQITKSYFNRNKIKSYTAIANSGLLSDTNKKKLTPSSISYYLGFIDKCIIQFINHVHANRG